MAGRESKSLAQLTDALERHGASLRELFESIDWTSRRQDGTRWTQLRSKLSEFESLSALVEARRARLKPEAASTLKPWLDRLIHSVASRALQAEARLAELQHRQREVPLFGREIFAHALRRLDRLIEQVRATTAEPDNDRLMLERAQSRRQDLIELIHRAPEIPEFGRRPAQPEQRIAA
jgi:hypothetical protein